MDTTQRANLGKWQGLLYPVMLIAAIALIVFSLAGIATMAGWLPGVLSGNDAKVEQAEPQMHQRARPLRCRSRSPKPRGRLHAPSARWSKRYVHSSPTLRRPAPCILRASRNGPVAEENDVIDECQHRRRNNVQLVATRRDESYARWKDMPAGGAGRAEVEVPALLRAKPCQPGSRNE